MCPEKALAQLLAGKEAAEEHVKGQLKSNHYFGSAAEEQALASVAPACEPPIFR